MTKELDAALNEIAELKKQLEFFKSKCEHQTEQYNQLLQNFKNFQRHRFGSRSEKFIDSDNPQLELFTDKKLLISDENLQPQEPENNVVSIDAYKRRKKIHKRLPPGIQRREVIIPAENKNCVCGKEKTVIRYEVTELFNYHPPVYEMIVQKREVVVCEKGCKGAMAIAPNPKRILPKSSITANLLAHIITAKLHDRQPFYHLEKQMLQRFGIDCKRNKLARWFIDSSQEVQPLINLLKDTIKDYDIGSIDPTSIQVLREPGRAASCKSYAYCIRGGPPLNGSIVYEYNPSDHKLFLLDWFREYAGYLHVDGQNIFDELSKLPLIKLVYCNTHARRYFEPVAKMVQSSDSLAIDAMRFYQKIYSIERLAKQGNLTAQERHQLRLEKMQPLFHAQKEWLDAYYPQLLPTSTLAKAFEYSIKRWDGLCRFFADGRLEMDNNHTEREIKPWVMARKNFLFANSVAGVKALCNYFSLIRTARLHEIDPYHYLVKIFEELPYCSSVDDYEKLLPWNIIINRVQLKAA